MTEGAFLTVSTLTRDEVTGAFNRAFEGYYLPMAQTTGSLGRIMRETDVTPSVSVALDVGGELAGICLVAVRGELAWIAGMGIGPRYRRRGYGRRLLLNALDGLRRADIREVSLEALAFNVPAISLYLSAGFVDKRELRVFQGPVRFSAESAPDDPGVRIGPLARRVALADFGAFHPIPPAWQREARSIARIQRRVTGAGLWRGPELRAYLLVTRDSDSVVLFDAGARDPDAATREADLARLMCHVAAGQDWVTVRAINVPAGDALGEALQALGTPVVARQREMILDLGGNGAAGDGVGRG